MHKVAEKGVVSVARTSVFQLPYVISFFFVWKSIGFFLWDQKLYLQFRILKTIFSTASRVACQMPPNRARMDIYIQITAHEWSSALASPSAALASALASAALASALASAALASALALALASAAHAPRIGFRNGCSRMTHRLSHRLLSHRASALASATVAGFHFFWSDSPRRWDGF